MFSMNRGRDGVCICVRDIHSKPAKLTLSRQNTAEFVKLSVITVALDFADRRHARLSGTLSYHQLQLPNASELVTWNHVREKVQNRPDCTVIRVERHEVRCKTVVEDELCLLINLAAGSQDVDANPAIADIVSFWCISI
jgi:hypothetical protein